MGLRRWNHDDWVSDFGNFPLLAGLDRGDLSRYGRNGHGLHRDDERIWRNVFLLADGADLAKNGPGLWLYCSDSLRGHRFGFIPDPIPIPSSRRAGETGSNQRLNSG